MLKFAKDIQSERMAQESQKVPFYRSLKARLWVLALMAACPFILDSAYNAYLRIDEQEKNRAAVAYEFAEATVVRISDQIKASREILSALALSKDVSHPSSDRCSHYLAEVHEKARERYLNLLVRDKNGVIICSALKQIVGVNTADQKDFQRAVAKNGFVVGELKFSNVSKRPVVVVTMPVTHRNIDSDQPLYLSAALDFRWLVDQMMIEGKEHLFRLIMANQNGRVFLTIGLDENERNITHVNLEELSQKYRISQETSPEVPDGLIVYALVSKSIAKSQLILSAYEYALILSLISLMVLVGVSWFARKTVLQWVMDIDKLADNLIKGDFKARIISPDDQTELSQLAQRLNMVAATLEDNTLRLEEKRNLLASALANISDAFVIYDKDDKLAVWNSKYEQLYSLTATAIKKGVTFENIIRAGLSTGQYADAAGREEEWVAARMEQHRNPQGPIEQQLSDGKWLRIEERKLPDGSTVGLRTDITEIKKRETQLMQQAEELSRYAYLASHDLQEPLRKIHTYCGILEMAYRQNNREEIERCLSVLTRSARLGRTLVGDLLRYSKMRDRPLDRAEFNLKHIVNDVIEEVGEEMTPGHEAMQRQVTVDVSDCRVLGDPSLIRQVIQNLFSNALKYKSSNSAADVRLRTVPVPNGALVLLVEDKGIGFDEKLKHQIFQPFKRLVGKSEYEGSGIGLALVKSIIDKHGWEIDVRSEPGKGSSFMIMIPAHDVLSQHVVEEPAVYSAQAVI